MAVTAVIGTTATKLVADNIYRKCVHISPLGSTHALYISFSETELKEYGYVRGYEISVDEVIRITSKKALYGITLDAAGGYSLIEEVEDEG